MLACGIGCRRGATVTDIEAAIDAARHNAKCKEAIAIVATEASKLSEPGLREAAHRLGAALIGYDIDALATKQGEVLTNSAAAQRHKGVASVSEAAALLAAGPNARLLAPRVAVATATCALAIGDGEAA